MRKLLTVIFLCLSFCGYSQLSIYERVGDNGREQFVITSCANCVKGYYRRIDPDTLCSTLVMNIISDTTFKDTTGGCCQKTRFVNNKGIVIESYINAGSHDDENIRFVTVTLPVDKTNFPNSVHVLKLTQPEAYNIYTKLILKLGPKYLEKKRQREKEVMEKKLKEEQNRKDTLNVRFY